MKINLYVQVNQVEPLINILKYYKNSINMDNENNTTIEFSLIPSNGSVMVSLDSEEYMFLSDKETIQQV